MLPGMLVTAMLILSGWPMAHGDHLGTGRAAELELDEQVWWTWKAGSHIAAAPVVGDERLIVADRDGMVTALDAGTGRVLWQHAMGGGVVSAPALALGRVFVVDLAGTLVALDAATGEVMDQATIGASRAPITVSEGKLYVGDEEGKLHAFTALSLDSLWTFSIADVSEQAPRTNMSLPITCETKPHPARAIRTAASVHADHVIVGSMNHYVYAVDERGNPDGTTSVAWRYKTADIVTATPLIDPATMQVYVAGYDEKVISLAVNGGKDLKCIGGDPKPAWSVSLPGKLDDTKVHATPAFDGQQLYIAGNNGHVYAVNKGKETWRVDSGAPVLAAPIVAGSVVVVGNGDGDVQWRSTSNGSLLQSFDAEGPVVGLAAADGTVIIATADGVVQRIGGTPPPRPDLLVESILPTGSGIIITIRNAGIADAINTTLDIHLNGTYTASYDVPPLLAGASAEVFHLSFGDPNATITVIVDPNNLVLEEDPTNNEASHEPSRDVVPEAVAPVPESAGPWLGVPWWGWVLVGFVTVAAGGGGFWFWQRSRFTWDAFDGAEPDEELEGEEDEDEEDAEPDGDW